MANDRPVRTGPYPEMTWAAVLVGWGLGALIAISIGYAALTLVCYLYYHYLVAPAREAPTDFVLVG